MSARTVDFLWRERGDPETRQKLSADTIIEAAIAIADADGLAAVSMQRIGRELGYTAMGLYRHVPGKAELIAAMTDTAYGPPPRPPKSRRWRAEVEAWVEALWQRYETHPWTVQVPTRGTPIGPNELAWFEALARPLATVGGLDVISAATFLSSAIRDLARITFELDPDQAAYAELLAQRIDPQCYPTLSRLFGTDHGADLTPITAHGVRLFLDGIEKTGKT